MEAAYKLEEKFSYADYLMWEDDERWELIDGDAYSMAPAPSTEHQEVSGNLYYQLKKFLNNRDCKVFAAPFDVRFMENAGDPDSAIDTVLQPDVSVICDPAKIDKRGAVGAPDFIAEILSPYTTTRDFKDKYLIYEKHKVREYWIIDPSNKTVYQYCLLENGLFAENKIYFSGDEVSSSALAGFSLKVDELFI